MNALVGTVTLAWFFARRDRVRLAVWVSVLGLMPLLTATAFIGLYPTEAGRQELAATIASSPALVALIGPLPSATIGGLTFWRVGTILAVLGGVMAVLTVIRHTRDDEEAGRRELLGATVVGRVAPLAAAVAVTVAAGLSVAALNAAGLVALGEEAAGSVAYGVGIAGVIAVFASVGAVAAQLTHGASTARGIGIGGVAAAYLLRLAGDGGEASGLGWLSWASPLGWYGRLSPFGQERWWVVVLWAGLAAALGGVALGFMARRDIGAGVIQARPGPARAGRTLSSAGGLGWRLQRGPLLAWTVGLGLMGLVFGALGDAVTDLLSENPQLAAMVEALGGSQTFADAFLSAGIGVIALISTAYALRSVLRLRVEEEELRAEPVLATATPRWRWVASHLAFALGGPVIILATAGLMAGAVYGALVGRVAEQAATSLGAALVNLPAVWVLVGLAVVLFGLTPRLTALSWAVLVACLLLGQLGRILQLPDWALDLSPFTHIPLLPAEELRWLPLTILAGTAAGLIGVGVGAFRRRDIQSA